MATALQQQLAVIAANSTHQLDLKAQKARHSKSLLFEARDASTQNFDTIYQICLEGFEELCQLDARFVPFSRNLFSEQSKNEDRTQMTAKEVEELDSVIDRFLGLLGGRLLLKPAMKAAEWLVRRFRVHEYNTETVLLTFLPYHGSHIFPTLLSILPDQLPSNFRFLHPYVTSLQSPPRHAIVAATSNNSAFFTSFSHYVLNVAKARHQSALLLGFWASVTAQAVNGMIDSTRSGRETIRKQKEEDLLLKVLPILQTALSIKDVPELYLGSCMVMTILAAKSSLSEKALNAMMEAVAGGWTDQTLEDGMVTLAVLAEEKQDLTLPNSVVRAVTKQADVLKYVNRIASKCRADHLITGIAIGAVHLIASKENVQASGILAGALRLPYISGESKLEVLVIAMEAVADSGANDAQRKQLLSPIHSFAEQDSSGHLITLAAQKAETSLGRLDADLALQIHDKTVDDGNENDPETMQIDEKPASETHNPSLDVEKLAKLPSKPISFLDAKHDKLFEEYSEAFVKAVSPKDDLGRLLKVLSPDKSSFAQHSTMGTFLARLWTSSFPFSARAKALQITAQRLQRSKQEPSSADMQALLPYLVAALADPAKPVRLAASSACLALKALYENSAAAKSSQPNVWCQHSLYGQRSSQIHWIPTLDAQRLFSEAVATILEECVVDSNYLVQSLADSINGAKSDGKELKSTLRASAYAFLASHTVLSPAEGVKIRLLSILSKVGKIAGTARTQILLPYVRTHFASSRAESQNDALSRALMQNVTHRSAEEIEFLRELACGRLASGSGPHSLAFDGIRQLWAAMKDAARMELLNWLLDLGLNQEVTDDIQSEAVETLRSLSIPSDVLVQLAESLPSVSDLQGHHTPAKKQRTSRTSETPKPGSLDRQKLDIAIRRWTLVLELVEELKPENHPQLLKGLFHLLSELHHYKTLLDSELVYLQGLIVNSLLSVVNGLKTTANKEVDRSVVRPDLIVDCVRTTSSTQVHHAALLLMSSLASWAPDLVLHSVMPLFTFMSSTILKQSDDYSAHVTDQTVARIIPPLAASLKKRGRDLISGAAELLLSFTAAFEHIPLHRRPGLFRHLVTTLGAEESLFAIAAMLIERYPAETNLRQFVAELMDHFHVKVQLSSVRQYLDLVFDTLKVKRGLSDVILGFGEKNADQAKEATSVLLDGLADVLGQNTLRKRLAKELKGSSEQADELRVSYSVILEKTMQLGLQIKPDDDRHDAASNVLTSVLSLMPTKDFIESSAMLMQTGSDEIRQQVFYSLETRVSSAKRADAEMQRVFMDVLPNCSLFIVESQPVETRLAAIACVDRISEKFGKTNRAEVNNAAQPVMGDSAFGSTDYRLRRMSLLCLASMVEVLGDEFIALLPTALGNALRYMQESVSVDEDERTEEGQALLSAGFSLAMAILDYIPWMLSGSYLDRLLKIAAEADSNGAAELKNLAARKVSAQDCFAAIERIWEDVAGLGDSAAQYTVALFHAAIKHHTKATITKNVKPIFAILLNAFDLRRNLTLEDDEDAEVDPAIFDEVDSAAMDVVLKLNDAAFRPFFVRFTEWATKGLSKKDKSGTVQRCISLYSFSLTLFDQLKSLVTSYAGYLLENAATLLKTLSANDEFQAQLLETVIKALASNFSHDQDGFWQSPTHFDAIAAPLLSALQCEDETIVNDHAIPAIAEFAGAANSPEHHKTLNGIFMSYMRHGDAGIRLAAVKCQRAVLDKLNVDWIGLLPEWLPAISELQEDDDGVVERETLRWIQQIEDVTGESLYNMLQ
ncbi:hypothetical protein M409DRAFT_69761 [Zasmidium cellare ATCC 36951]|uniref:U3 small nucleolar RNA-associated protein 10 n=1 Tax=Zasmidium cellare ATCC 36951 TaxID=1080233 RepID=A0A6A6C698_ZASCE|nr:uncharacterized protein M409DRAFT_69761 [Zasmidium cellare ATCC 36951]KAF2161402.1 hypothetical protein M409DRAFT_69761 [Zasmidium cellare ATCC 36951]